MASEERTDRGLLDHRAEAVLLRAIDLRSVSS
jgi:hypothetical protein